MEGGQSSRATTCISQGPVRAGVRAGGGQIVCPEPHMLQGGLEVSSRHSVRRVRVGNKGITRFPRIGKSGGLKRASKGSGFVSRSHPLPEA